jgi:hypothetical protein
MGAIKHSGFSGICRHDVNAFRIMESLKIPKSEEDLAWKYQTQSYKESTLAVYLEHSALFLQ